MNLTDKQLEFIFKFTNKEVIDQDKLVEYICKHNVIKKDVFKFCSRKDLGTFFLLLFEGEYGFFNEVYTNFKTMDRETFIKRMPFIFYGPEFSDYKQGFISLCSGLQKENLDDYFTSFEFLFYDMGFTLKEILSYPVNQVQINTDIPFSKMNYRHDIKTLAESQLYPSTIFHQWVHYIHLCNKIGRTDYFPDCFIAEYNYVLEACNLKPIMYSLAQDFEVSFKGDGKYFKCDGVFPRSENNNPILKWMNIKVYDIESISYTGNQSLPGILSIKITPSSRIYFKKPQKDEWYAIYSGPLNIEFDYSALKGIRIEKGYTQQQIADEIGIAKRTYQKWEKGETCPDGFHLIQIMSWFEIDNFQSLTSFKKIENQEY